MTRDDGQTPPVSKVSLRRVLARLTALALSVAPGAANARAVEETELRELEDDREIDRESLDVAAAAGALGRGLAVALSELRPLAATQLAATWSLSNDPVRRLAVGIALEWPFALVGDALVIDHLARDPSSEIRAAAARAAWIRQQTSVLERLGEDADPIVRAIAHAARR